MADADGWQQPERYGEAADEIRAARERVGMVDVSPNGKLDLKGAAVEALPMQDLGLPVRRCRLATDHLLLLTAPELSLGKVLEAVQDRSHEETR